MLYQYFTARWSSVKEAYTRPSTRKVAIEQSIMADMVNEDGYNYKVMSRNVYKFSCGYMTGAGLTRKVHLIYPSHDEVYDVPSLMPWIVPDGEGNVRLELRVSVIGFDDVIVPYNQLIPELKPMFSDAIKIWEGHISNIR